MTSAHLSAEAHKQQAPAHLPGSVPALPRINAPAHHNKLIPSVSAPNQEAQALPQHQDGALPDNALGHDVTNNPLRQKSSLLAGTALAGSPMAGHVDEEDDPRDVIPSLPRVSYSEGGEKAAHAHTVCKGNPALLCSLAATPDCIDSDCLKLLLHLPYGRCVSCCLSHHTTPVSANCTAADVRAATWGVWVTALTTVYVCECR